MSVSENDQLFPVETSAWDLPQESYDIPEHLSGSLFQESSIASIQQTVHSRLAATAVPTGRQRSYKPTSRGELYSHFAQVDSNKLKTPESMKRLSHAATAPGRLGSIRSITNLGFNEDSNRISRGYRSGGPKESRLKRVALLTTTKESGNLYPIKLKHLPARVSPEKIESSLKKYGEIVDIYIPMDFERHKYRTGTASSSDFAVVRFSSSQSVDRLLEEQQQQAASPTIDGQRVILDTVEKQHSYFSNGTGYHGICNEPILDGSYKRNIAPPLEQEISLKSCIARSGYPWNSVRELKFLAPHPPPYCEDGFTLRVDGLPHHISDDEVRRVFSVYGEVLSVSCPKPRLCSLRSNDENNGVAIIIFADQRDLQAATVAVQAKEVKFDGQAPTVQTRLPRYWPTESTRRYY